MMMKRYGFGLTKNLLMGCPFDTGLSGISGRPPPDDARTILSPAIPAPDLRYSEKAGPPAKGSSNGRDDFPA
jgi:hypothetical protein